MQGFFAGQAPRSGGSALGPPPARRACTRRVTRPTAPNASRSIARPPRARSGTGTDVESAGPVALMNVAERALRVVAATGGRREAILVAVATRRRGLAAASRYCPACWSRVATLAVRPGGGPLGLVPRGVLEEAIHVRLEVGVRADVLGRVLERLLDALARVDEVDAAVVPIVDQALPARLGERRARRRARGRTRS